MKIDLHSHTYYSDGVLSPEDLVLEAKKNNVDVLALTDHDSVFGIDEALHYGKIHGVGVIPGIEISTFFRRESIHIVGLFYDGVVPEFFKKFSQDIIDVRKNRAIKMMENIKRYYDIKVDIEGLLAESTIITRGNMLRSLVKANEGMTIQEASRYISNDSKAYIPFAKLSTEEGIRILKRYKAVAILAHPTLIKHSPVTDLLDLGFDGIEVRYPKNKPGEEEYFFGLARRYQIYASAGSDFHGDGSHAPMGTSVLDEKEFSGIAKAISYKE